MIHVMANCRAKLTGSTKSLAPHLPASLCTIALSWRLSRDREQDLCDSNTVSKCVLPFCVFSYIRPYSHGLRRPQKPNTYCDDKLFAILSFTSLFTVGSGAVWRRHVLTTPLPRTKRNINNGPTAEERVSLRGLSLKQHRRFARGLGRAFFLD